MKKSTVSYTVDKKGYHIFLEKVPAYICGQCGEKYFDESETKAIQDLLVSFEKKWEMLKAA